MTLRYKILGSVLVLVAVALLSLALWVSHDSACGTAPLLPTKTQLMKAIVYRCYGPPDVLKFEDVAKPAPAPNEVLVKVHAASVNPLDWHYMRGTPYIVRLDSGFGKPENPRLGVDFAGTVEAVGTNVKRFKPGDEVFGGKFGSFAEYVSVREERAVVLKPANLTFEQAASVPIAAITALQGLRDKGKIQPGQKVLINGATGGVGTFAVQIAKSFGAEVTAVCSTRNVDLVRSIGADHVIDYTKEDFTKSDQRYDVIFDNVCNHSFSERRRVLTTKGICVLAGMGGAGVKQGEAIGRIAGNLFTARALSSFTDQKFAQYRTKSSKQDLIMLGDLIQVGKLRPVVERTYKLNDAPEALRYLNEGHARGKIVIAVE